jgi:hypothetical protein
MALVSAISYSLEDYSGDSRSVRVYVPATATLAEIQALSDVLAAELDAITGMKIIGASVDLALTLPGGLKAAAVTDTDAERGVNWAMNCANTVYSHTIRTPGATNAIVDGEAVVVTADVTDWLTALAAGDGTTQPTDQYANDITSEKSAKVTFHK